MSDPVKTQPPFEAHPFWRFSLMVYADKNIEQQCLFLQNHCQMNVNILLYACWQAIDNVHLLTPDNFAYLDQSIMQWNSKIQSLRTLRQKLKQLTDTVEEVREPVNEKLKNIELAAEYIEQTMMASLNIPRKPHNLPASEVLKSNLQNYGIFKNQKDDSWITPLASRIAEVAGLSVSLDVKAEQGSPSERQETFFQRLRHWLKT